MNNYIKYIKNTNSGTAIYLSVNGEYKGYVTLEDSPKAGAYEAKLVDGQGKAYANQKIEFNINGVMYQRTTNADGVAKLNINLQAGKYIITASYGQARISNTVTVTA